MAPPRMAKPLVAKLNADVHKVMQQPDVRERILADGSEPTVNTPEEFRKYLLADLNKWTKLVKESGAKLD